MKHGRRCGVWIGFITLSLLTVASAGAADRAQPPFWFSRCEHYLDGGLGAGACSESQLEAALRAGRMAEGGSFSIAIAGHRTGTASGVVQVIGGPVPPGTVARFSGTPANDEVVVLNC